MDYLKLSKNLKKEFDKAATEKYRSINIVIRIILMLIFLPYRISFFFARLAYWLTWFFFKGIAAPADYLQIWLKEQREGLGQAAQAVLYFVCMPAIFAQRVLLAFSSFAFFFQWFGLMLYAYFLSLGGVRWQPVITEAKFDEE